VGHAAECREWSEVVKGRGAFWNRDRVDRPLIGIIYKAYQDAELVAASVGEGELQPSRIDPRPILSEYDGIAAAREAIGDDKLGVAEPLLGIPWLEAICGCQVTVPGGKSLWPESPGDRDAIGEHSFSEANPWYRKVLEVLQAVVDHVAGRLAYCACMRPHSISPRPWQPCPTSGPSTSTSTPRPSPSGAPCRP